MRLLLGLAYEALDRYFERRLKGPDVSARDIDVVFWKLVAKLYGVFATLATLIAILGSVSVPWFVVAVFCMALFYSFMMLPKPKIHDPHEDVSLTLAMAQELVSINEQLQEIEDNRYVNTSGIRAQSPLLSPSRRGGIQVFRAGEEVRQHPLQDEQQRSRISYYDGPVQGDMPDLPEGP